MGLAKTVLSVAFWAFPTFFLTMWCISRVVAYFFKSYEWNLKDFASAVMPADVDPSIPARWDQIVTIYFDPNHIKYYTIRMHTALAVVMGFICMFQLMPFLRVRYLNVHRTLGYVYVALLVPFAIEMSTTLFVIGLLPLSPFVVIGNTIGLIAMVGGTSVGVWAAKNHKVRLHRACMLINAAGLYINPTQRFAWSVISKNNLGGPFKTWNQWITNSLETSEVAAVSACFLTALVYITVITPGQGKARKAKAQ